MISPSTTAASVKILRLPPVCEVTGVNACLARRVAASRSKDAVSS